MDNLSRIEDLINRKAQRYRWTTRLAAETVEYIQS